ncbi:MAG: hypothetical protein U0X92_10740 [Anaerolineales bacterium]
MKIRLFLPFVLLLLAAQDSPPVAITSPASGEVLRGEITIIGSTDIPNFFSAQLDFKYASDNADSWFPLATLSQPALDSPLYLWNTASITDGDYILRLRVTLADGTFQDVTAPITIQKRRADINHNACCYAHAQILHRIQVPTRFSLATIANSHRHPRAPRRRHCRPTPPR